MADDDLRSLEREASGGDPEAVARFLRQKCRAEGHAWNHYKGGDHVCRVCGESAPSDPREFGAQTMHTSVSPSEMRRLMDEEMRKYGVEQGESQAEPEAEPE